MANTFFFMTEFWTENLFDVFLSITGGELKWTFGYLAKKMFLLNTDDLFDLWGSNFASVLYYSAEQSGKV